MVGTSGDVQEVPIHLGKCHLFIFKPPVSWSNGQLPGRVHLWTITLQSPTMILC